MGRLVYTVLASLDGFVADESGRFDWAEPGEDVHRAVNELEATVGTYLYGRRLYEVMAAWQDVPGVGHGEGVEAAYADLWRSADKVVHSTTLEAVTTPRTRLERSFDPVAARASAHDLDSDTSVGGPTLAAAALRAGVVDDVHLVVFPVLVGAGTSCWPPGLRLDLRLAAEHRFADGTVHLHYTAGR